MSELNVQNQQKIDWPSQLVVARAYVDQLVRAQALPSARIAALNRAIGKAQRSHLGSKDAAKLRSMAGELETSASCARTPADASRSVLSLIYRESAGVDSEAVVNERGGP